MKSTLFFLFTALLGTAAAAGGAEKTVYAHAGYFEDYEGTKTCLECHKDEAKSFFHSQHYQWEGETPDIVNSGGRRLGKMNTINDFCTNPAMNWIGESRNEAGDVVAKGCSKCHAGFGLLPAKEISQEQLENIDCLICHASGYGRDLYAAGDGSWEWRPILWKNRAGLNSVSKRISLPKRKMCLRCHSASGGGPNFKRGDIEYALADCDSEFDVHMASSGNDMQCVDCHAGEDHRVLGRGTDLSATDSPGTRLTCDGSCHGAAPHEANVLNHHAKRVACTTCHIREFAKEDATDMVRDWSMPSYHEEVGKYSATITLQKNVTPVYRWYNGTTWSQMLGEEVRRLDDGSVGIMLPQGSRNDKKSKIYAFKFHKGKLPVLDGRDWLIPITVEEFFGTGDIDGAVREAARKVYGIEGVKYRWADTARYMGLFHEVQPAANALRCLDCHNAGGRLDWKELGYDGDPLERLMK